jgi:hypothetical protein
MNKSFKRKSDEDIWKPRNSALQDQAGAAVVSRHGAIGTVAAHAPGRGRVAAAVNDSLGKGLNEKPFLPNEPILKTGETRITAGSKVSFWHFVDMPEKPDQTQSNRMRLRGKIENHLLPLIFGLDNICRKTQNRNEP